ncbi:hypothetical protein [Lachnoclostridium phytofermentans]|uniref:Lipoprotein n=1 Tax=Lachnoclostridium phytofermentans (strain ATCC 700394 / DSM 18823 / ISDg) TaxID=357809 RepID=A9KRS3_LACP7|nr:hypothetical protein [Lachnoclostridium phytofermentans]ABX43567.1 hypothetical protein Cphy_3213 [Lachnoclostridium phytofermentans ISDg]
MKLRKLKKIVSCLIVSLILAACSSQKPVEETIKISADYPSYKSASDICDKADLAVKVKLKEVTPNVIINFSLGQEPANFPVSLYSFEVLDTLKGSYTEDEISIPVIGGIMDGKYYETSDAEIKFMNDKEYLLLLESFEEEGVYPVLLNDTQSVFEYDAQRVESTVASTNPFSLSDILNELNAQ